MEFEFLYALQQLHTPLVDKFMIFVTTLGNGGVFWLVLAIILLCTKKTRRCGWLILVSMAICYLLGNLALKNIVGRARPCQIDTSILLKIPMPGEYSFPSGHTLHAFTAATMIFLHHKKAGVACLILAVLIAFSRMYLFVHFPTDVLAGMLLGIIVAHTVYRISLRKRKAEQKL